MLSTPPAFILSQDQTLMFKSVCPASCSSGITVFWVVIFITCSLKFRMAFACPRIASLFLEFSGLHYCLFVKVQTTLGVVTNMLYIFAISISLSFLFSGNFDILSCPFHFVNNFFRLFLISFEEQFCILQNPSLLSLLTEVFLSNET